MGITRPPAGPSAAAAPQFYHILDKWMHHHRYILNNHELVLLLDGLVMPPPPPVAPRQPDTSPDSAAAIDRAYADFVCFWNTLAAYAKDAIQHKNPYEEWQRLAEQMTSLWQHPLVSFRLKGTELEARQHGATTSTPEALLVSETPRAPGAFGQVSQTVLLQACVDLMASDAWMRVKHSVGALGTVLANPFMLPSIYQSLYYLMQFAYHVLDRDDAEGLRRALREDTRDIHDIIQSTREMIIKSPVPRRRVEGGASAWSADDDDLASATS